MSFGLLEAHARKRFMFMVHEQDSKFNRPIPLNEIQYPLDEYMRLVRPDVTDVQAWMTTSELELAMDSSQPPRTLSSE